MAHKERLKQMRQNVDVLTLTATPIPRSLHMALAKVKDMSVIETPRRPVSRANLRGWVVRTVGGHPPELHRAGRFTMCTTGLRFTFRGEAASGFGAEAKQDCSRTDERTHLKE